MRSSTSIYTYSFGKKYSKRAMGTRIDAHALFPVPSVDFPDGQLVNYLNFSMEFLQNKYCL